MQTTRGRTRTGALALLAAAVTGTVVPAASPALATDASALRSPAVPYASDVFTWDVAGVPTSTSVSLAGCWGGADVATATASAGRVAVNKRTGEVTVTNARGLPSLLTVTVRYAQASQSAAGAVTLTSRAQARATSTSVAGPDCRPPAAPDAPAAGTAVQRNDATQLTWSEPKHNGAAITGYTVTCRPACPSTASGLRTDGATGTVISGLTYGQAYTFGVAATNAYGTGAASADSAPVVFAAVPGAPAHLSATGILGEGYASWLAAADHGSAVESYRVRVHRADTNALVSDVTVPATSCCRATVRGLTVSTAYRVSVQATNAFGSGAPAWAGFTVLGEPGAPRLYYALPGDGYAALSWGATTDGGQPIWSYVVTAYGCTVTLYTCSLEPELTPAGELDQERSPGWRVVGTKELRVGSSPDVTAAGATLDWHGLTNGKAHAFHIRVSNYDWLSERTSATVVPHEGADGCYAPRLVC